MPPHLGGAAAIMRPPIFINTSTTTWPEGSSKKDDPDRSAGPPGAIASEVAPGREKVDKQSLEYILKSGLAGGLAGCAVCVIYNNMEGRLKEWSNCSNSWVFYNISHCTDC